MNNLPNRTMQIAAIVAFSLSFLTAPDVTKAAHLFCGAPLTSDTKLDADLDCTSSGTHGLIILANNVTVDLNSFTLTGVGGFNGVDSVGFDDVTIKNGTISDFGVGVLVEMAENVELNNLLINTAAGVGIDMRNVSEIEIKNVSLFGPSRNATPGSAIQLLVVDGFEIDNVDIHGYFGGVLITCIGAGCRTDPARPNTDGAVTNSTISDSRGIDLATATDVKISGNHVTDCTFDIAGLGNRCIGIVVGRSSEIEIENNYVHGNLRGIQLNNDVTNSEISANHVYDNIGNGIALVGNNPGSTGNRIESNITFGNGAGVFHDLFHDPVSSPNEWKDNSCDTKVGADIPDCSPP